MLREQVKMLNNPYALLSCSCPKLYEQNLELKTEVDKLKSSQAQADVIGKAEEWCERLDDPSILLGGTYGDYQKANDLLAYLKSLPTAQVDNTKLIEKAFNAGRMLNDPRRIINLPHYLNSSTVVCGEKWQYETFEDYLKSLKEKE